MPAAVEVAAYRITDEALTNATTHAQPAALSVEIEQSDGWLTVSIIDDGQGYSGQRDGGIGIDSMRERCEELGGHLEILPNNPGTIVKASLAID